MWSILSLLVENRPGVLFKITNMFRARNFNIDSISVGVTANPDFSRMTITTYGDAKTGKSNRKTVGQNDRCELFDEHHAKCRFQQSVVFQTVLPNLQRRI